MPVFAQDKLGQSLGKKVGVEVIDATNSELYSHRIFPPNTLLAVSANDGAIVKVCRELIFDGQLGQDTGDAIVEPTDVFASDAEGALLAGRWDVSAVATNTPTLDKTEGILSLSHAIEMYLDDQDDDFGVAASNGRMRRGPGFGTVQYEYAKGLDAGAAYKARIRHAEVFVVTAGVNDDLDFTEGVTGAAVATVTAGVYTAAGLATALQTAINAAATDNTYTVDFGSTLASKFSIVRATGTATISLNWSTGPNTATTIGELLGYSIAADDTGATTYSADNASDTQLFQYQVREYRHAATNPVKYWDGSAWQTTAQWVDVTWGASDSTFMDDVTLDEGSYETLGPARYELWLRPKSDYAKRAAVIGNIGLHEQITASIFDVRIVSGESAVFSTGPYWSRVGVIADNASKKLWISEYSE